MKNYYAEFLQRKISENIQTSEVSKVSKGQVLDKKQTFDTFDTSLPNDNQKNFVVGISAYIQKLQSSDIEFYVAPGFFEAGGRELTNIERENLRGQAGVILCHLHQAALNQFVFKPFPAFRKQFEFETNERVGIISETEQPDAATTYAAVRQTAHLWFERYFTNGVFEQKQL